MNIRYIKNVLKYEYFSKNISVHNCVQNIKVCIFYQFKTIPNFVKLFFRKIKMMSQKHKHQFLEYR